MWSFQEDGLLPHEDVKLKSERPSVSEEIIRELNPHNASNAASVEVSNETVNDEDGWTSMEEAVNVSKEDGDIEDISENEGRITIETELAKLDHAWERRKIDLKEEKNDDVLDELNKEVDNFDI